VSLCLSVAILAQATAGPQPLLHSPPAAFIMAESIIAELHGRLLRGIAAETAVHFQGLRAAAGHLRRAGVLDSRLAKKLAAVDCAYAISRHITAVSAGQCVDEVLAAIRCSTKEKTYLEQVANEKIAKDKADEEKADEMERFANEQVAKEKAEEEAAAKRKIDVEQAAVKAAEEAAAAKEKARVEQVAKAKAAVEKAAEQKAEEEKASKVAAEKAKKAAAEKLAAELDKDYAAMILAEMDAEEKAIEEEAAAKEEKARLEQVAAKEVAAKKKAAVGKTTTGEKAAKKAKGDKFANVNMDIEALAERIDSMPSSGWGWEQESWRRSGWR
jgi:hypothetical protein